MGKCFLSSLFWHYNVPIPQQNSKEITPGPWCNCQLSLSLASHLSMSLFLSVYPVSSPSAYSLSSLPPATFILQSCHFSVSSISFISFASVMSSLYLSFCLFLFVLQSNCQGSLPLYLLFFIPLLPLPSGFCIDFSQLTCLSLSSPFIALINFSAYEMMLLSSSSNFLTLSLSRPVSVRPAGGRGGSVLDGKKNEEEGWVKALQWK